MYQMFNSLALMMANRIYMLRGLFEAHLIQTIINVLSKNGYAQEAVDLQEAISQLNEYCKVEMCARDLGLPVFEQEKADEKPSALTFRGLGYIEAIKLLRMHAHQMYNIMEQKMRDETALTDVEIRAFLAPLSDESGLKVCKDFVDDNRTNKTSA